MAVKVAETSLNASTVDVLNVIRQNASAQYQNDVPVIEKSLDVPKIGEIICGHGALANEFLNALVNRIALVVVNSMTFNNMYKRLKKGYLEFGETVEEIFVNIAKVLKYSAEKAEARELKRTLPDVKSVFHAINWRVMYPVTIQRDELKRAFLSENGLADLVAKIVDSVYRAAEYDEFLLIKYLLIKSITSGGFYPVKTDGDLIKNAGTFRGMSNSILFPSKLYNFAGVTNNTPRDRQIIFMDAKFNGNFDVEVLARAFNMEKADVMGSLFLIDDWTTFDNERFADIRAESDGLEEVTQAELTLMTKVKAILVDENWFQIYDNLAEFTEKYVASGLYWNYFYHTWKTISYSPFHNAIAFVTDDATVTPPVSYNVTVTGVDAGENGIVVNLDVNVDADTLAPTAYQFIQTQAATTAGVAVQPYGAVILPGVGGEYEIEMYANGQIYTNTSTKINAQTKQGAIINLTKKG